MPGVPTLLRLRPYTWSSDLCLDTLATVLLSPQASSQSLSTSTRSQIPSTSTSSTNFETIIAAALEEYKKKTKKDIASHPLAAELKACQYTDAILAIL